MLFQPMKTIQGGFHLRAPDTEKTWKICLQHGYALLYRVLRAQDSKVSQQRLIRIRNQNDILCR